jgi:hypothetical protein
MKVAKSKRGVLVTVDRRGEAITLFLDDVEQSSADRKHWTQRDHVTHKKLDFKEFEAMKVSDSELADLAGYILARLNAYIEVGES